MASYETELQTYLAKYKYGNRALPDIVDVLTSFTDLRPALSEYAFNNGVSKEMIKLYGTIPVVYKGKLYNIPICIWLLDTHPISPPIVYVTPTSTMMIRQGRNVDANGQVVVPFLREWKEQMSDLVGLVNVLQVEFGEEPPVFTKQQSPTPQANLRLQPTTFLVDVEEDILKCPHCRQILEKPKMIPCPEQHAVCQNCVEAISVEQGADALTCPGCSQLFQLPPGGVDALPTNKLIVKLLEVRRRHLQPVIGESRG